MAEKTGASETRTNGPRHDGAVMTRSLDFPARPSISSEPAGNAKGYSSTDLAMGFADVRAGTWCKRVLEY